MERSCISNMAHKAKTQNSSNVWRGTLTRTRKIRKPNLHLRYNKPETEKLYIFRHLQKQSQQESEFRKRENFSLRIPNWAEKKKSEIIKEELPTNLGFVFKSEQEAGFRAQTFSSYDKSRGRITVLASQVRDGGNLPLRKCRSSYDGGRKMAFLLCLNEVVWFDDVARARFIFEKPGFKNWTEPTNRAARSTAQNRVGSLELRTYMIWVPFSSYKSLHVVEVPDRIGFIFQYGVDLFWWNIQEYGYELVFRLQLGSSFDSVEAKIINSVLEKTNHNAYFEDFIKKLSW